MKKPTTDSRVLITPTYRVAWVDMVASDPDADAIGVYVAVVLSAHFNNKTAETYASQKRIAALTKASPRAVWTRLKWMVDRGHLTKRRGGRASNTYGMPLENVARYCEIYFGKSRTPLRDLDPEISQTETEISQNTTLNLAPGCERTLPLNSYKNSYGARQRGNGFAVVSAQLRSRNVIEAADRLVERVRSFDEPAPTWQQRRDAGHAALHAFGQALDRAEAQSGQPTEYHQLMAAIRNRLGAAVAENWFADIEIASSGGVGTVFAPTKFKRSWISDHYAAALAECWRSVDPTVTRVEIVVGVNGTQGGGA